MRKSENIKAGSVVETTMGHTVTVVYVAQSVLHPGQFYVEYANGDRGWARLA